MTRLLDDIADFLIDNGEGILIGMLLLMFIAFIPLCASTMIASLRQCKSYPDEPAAYVQAITQDLIDGKLPPCAVAETINKANSLRNNNLCVSIEPCDGAD